MFSILLFLACSEEPALRNPVQVSVAQAASTNELDLAQRRITSLEAQIVYLKSQTDALNAANLENMNLRVVADAYVAGLKERGDVLFVCAIVVGTGEGSSTDETSIHLFKTGEVQPFLDKQDVAADAGDGRHEECDKFEVVYDASGKASVRYQN